jgi:ABC-type antimicrobial peptide transport system permease subunit
VRPAEIEDAESMQGIPLLVGGLLVVATVIGLAVAIVISVRGRRRELAMLRALGFDARQVRTSVRVQSLATVIPAIALGVPGGVVLGRFLWQSFASELGVLPTVSVPIVWVAATVVGAVVVALVASAFPARVAARIAPATALRAE